MKHKPFKNQIKSLQDQFDRRRILLKPIVKKFGKPVIVHAVHDAEVFYKILKDGKIKLPENHNSLKKTPYLERFFKNDNSIYYSLGFVYNVAYKWRFNLMFDVEFLRYTKYYSHSLSFRCYKRVVDYLYEHDKTYLDKLSKMNATTKAVMNRYYTEPFNGKVRKIFEFWKIEKELFYLISRYPKKEILIKMIKGFEKDLLLDYPYSKKNALKVFLKDGAPEILGKKENNLLKNPYFIGFFIDGKINKKIKVILKERYSDKLLFDGKKIVKINEIK